MFICVVGKISEMVYIVFCVFDLIVCVDVLSIMCVFGVKLFVIVKIKNKLVKYIENID